MKLIEQSWEWIQKPVLPLQLIEKAGRTCYKSEDKITEDSAEKFVKGLIKSGHESVIEHASASVKFITNRGVTHELVRHRLAAYSQESTRYCNYGNKDMEFIKPVWIKEDVDIINTNPSSVLTDQSSWTFYYVCATSEKFYNVMLDSGWSPQQAREILPNALKTEIVMTANLREWRHVFKLRTSKAAHPQIRELMISCLEGFKKEIPIIFDGIDYDRGPDKNS